MTVADEATAGIIMVISGPGGAGKGTVVEEIGRRDGRLRISRSWTTRDQRPGEPDDAYYFVSHEEFEAAIEADAFLEYDHHFGNYYGSPVPEVGDTTDLVLEIDVNGAIQIHENGHDALFIFIDTPSVEVQRERMIQRGDELHKVDERIAGGERERQLAKQLPYRHVINDDIASCADEILALIDEYRSPRSTG